MQKLVRGVNWQHHSVLMRKVAIVIYCHNNNYHNHVVKIALGEGPKLFMNHVTENRMYYHHE
jgi:hypothetical protein